MRPGEESSIQQTEFSPPLSLGFGDCAALLLSALLMAAAVFWPSKKRTVFQR